MANDPHIPAEVYSIGLLPIPAEQVRRIVAEEILLVASDLVKAMGVDNSEHRNEILGAIAAAFSEVSRRIAKREIK